MLGKNKESYIRLFIESATKISLEPMPDAMIQSVAKTAEASWEVDNYPVEPGDEPFTKPSPRKELA